MPDWDWIADDGGYFFFPFFHNVEKNHFLSFRFVKIKKTTVDHAIVYSCGIFGFKDLIITMKERWLAMKEKSEHLGVTYETIYKCLGDHEMLGYRMEKIWKIKCKEVDMRVKS